MPEGNMECDVSCCNMCHYFHCKKSTDITEFYNVTVKELFFVCIFNIMF